MTQRRRGRPLHPDILTPAEWRVLEELRKGGTNAEIAVRLGVSPDAVKFHISNMLAKLGLDNRRQLAAWRPTTDLRRLRSWLTIPVSLVSLARPLGLAGAGTLTLVGVAAVVIVLVVVEGNGRPTPVALPTTPTPQSSPATPTPTSAPSPTPPPQTTPTPTSAPSPTPPPQATPTPTSTPSPTPPPESPILKEGFQDLRPGYYIIRDNWALVRVRIPEFPAGTQLIAGSALVEAGCPEGEGTCCWSSVEFELKRGAAPVGSLSFKTSERWKRENAEIKAHDAEILAFFEEMADSIGVTAVSCD